MEYIIVKDGVIVDHCCGGVKPEDAIEVPSGFPGYVGVKLAALKDDFSGIKPVSQQVDEGLLSIPEGFKINSKNDALVRMSQAEIDVEFPPEVWAVPGSFEAVFVHKIFNQEGNFGYFPPKNMIKMEGEPPSSTYIAGEDGSWIFDREKQDQENLAEAQAKTEKILTSRMQINLAQTMSFSSAEFTILATAGLFESWVAGHTYAKGYRLEHKGVVYEVVQEVTSIENQPPDAVGMLAIYRPLSVDSETGEEPDGTKENPYVYMYGMDVEKDKYYTYEGKLWLAKTDMKPCVWNPGTPNVWEEVIG